MRIGVVASSAGSVLEALIDIARDRPVEWFVVTDRPCRCEEVAARHRVPAQRIVAKDNRLFSKNAAAVFERARVDAVLLFFLRLVTPEIFAAFPTFNLHPSLLPAFSGFGAIRRARAAGACQLGATLHLVNAATDGGPIFAQTADEIDPAASETDWARVSFRQKVRLGAWLLDALLAGTVTCDPTRATVQGASVTPGGPAVLPEFNDRALAAATEAWIAGNAEPLESDATR